MLAPSCHLVKLVNSKPKADVRKYKRAGRSRNQDTKSKVENQESEMLINRQAHKQKQMVLKGISIKTGLD